MRGKRVKQVANTIEEEKTMTALGRQQSLAKLQETKRFRNSGPLASVARENEHRDESTRSHLFTASLSRKKKNGGLQTARLSFSLLRRHRAKPSVQTHSRALHPRQTLFSFFRKRPRLAKSWEREHVLRQRGKRANARVGSTFLAIKHGCRHSPPQRTAAQWVRLR